MLKALQTKREVFDWTQQRITAAALIAESQLTLKEIAEQIGVTHKAVWTWRKHPEFDRRVKAMQAEMIDEIRRTGIACKAVRVEGLKKRHAKLLSIIEARAQEMLDRHVRPPGGETGMITESIKIVGVGPTQEAIPEPAVDVALLREIREIEKQLAQELGEWNDNKPREVNVNIKQQDRVRKAAEHDLSKLSVEELETLLALQKKMGVGMIDVEATPSVEVNDEEQQQPEPFFEEPQTESGDGED